MLMMRQLISGIWTSLLVAEREIVSVRKFTLLNSGVEDDGFTNDVAKKKWTTLFIR